MRLADLAFEMITSLDELNSRFGMDYLRTVERHFDRPDAIALYGRRGESVAVRFVVSNDEPDASVVHCVMSEVRREDGVGHAFDTAGEDCTRRYSAGTRCGIGSCLRDTAH